MVNRKMEELKKEAERLKRQITQLVDKVIC